jgi:hypothetical protein
VLPQDGRLPGPCEIPPCLCQENLPSPPSLVANAGSAILHFRLKQHTARNAKPPSHMSEVNLVEHSGRFCGSESPAPSRSRLGWSPGTRKFGWNDPLAKSVRFPVPVARNRGESCGFLDS